MLEKYMSCVTKYLGKRARFMWFLAFAFQFLINGSCCGITVSISCVRAVKDFTTSCEFYDRNFLELQNAACILWIY